MRRRGALFDEKTSLSLTIAVGPRELSYSRVQVPPWPYFTFSDPKLPQSEGSGYRSYIPQEEGDRVTFSSQGYGGSSLSYVRLPNFILPMSGASLALIVVNWVLICDDSRRLDF
jgi:hypothetical protein